MLKVKNKIMKMMMKMRKKMKKKVRKLKASRLDEEREVSNRSLLSLRGLAFS